MPHYTATSNHPRPGRPFQWQHQHRPLHKLLVTPRPRPAANSSTHSSRRCTSNSPTPRRGCYGCRRLRTPMAKELLQRQIDATDRQIDGLGYWFVWADGGGDWDCGGECVVLALGSLRALCASVVLSLFHHGDTENTERARKCYSLAFQERRYELSAISFQRSARGSPSALGTSASP